MGRGDPSPGAGDDEGRRGELTVIAGAIEGIRPLAAPPDSYASRPDSDLAIWHLVLEPLARWVVPPAPPPTPYAPSTSSKAPCRWPAPRERIHGVVVRPDEPVAVTAGPEGAEVLLLQGRPIGEPVAQYGPFVMNDRAGIEQALRDYQSTGFRRLALADRRSRAAAGRRPFRPARRRAPRAARRAGRRTAGLTQRSLPRPRGSVGRRRGWE